MIQTCFIAAESETEVYKLANKTIARMRLYMISNQLHINLRKCTMYIHTFQAQHQYQRTSFLCSYKDTCHTHTTLTSYWSNQTKNLDKARFLGVIIDEKLTWDDHINYLESKLLSCIATIKRIRRFIPKFHHKQLYHSIFLPHLNYGITSWGGTCPNKLEKVFSLQKRCICILFGNKVSL